MIQTLHEKALDKDYCAFISHISDSNFFHITVNKICMKTDAMVNICMYQKWKVETYTSMYQKVAEHIMIIR